MFHSAFIVFMVTGVINELRNITLMSFFFSLSANLPSRFHEVHKIASRTFKTSLSFHMNGLSVACCKCFISCQRHSAGVNRSLEIKIRGMFYGIRMRLLLRNIMHYYRQQQPTEKGKLLS